MFKGLTVCSYCWRIRKWWILIFIVSSLATWLNFLIGWLLLTPTLVLSPKSCQMKVKRGGADICSCVSTDMLFQRQWLGHRLSSGLTLLPRLQASPSVKAGFLFMQWSRCRSGDSLPWPCQHCFLQKSLEILHMWTLSPGFRIYRCRFGYFFTFYHISRIWEAGSVKKVDSIFTFNQNLQSQFVYWLSCASYNLKSLKEQKLKLLNRNCCF